jgi:hypothetical protein
MNLNAKLLFLLIGLGVFASANAYNVDEYGNVIMKMLGNDKLEEDFQNNIDYLLQIEPNYYNYTLKAPFSCQAQPSPSVPTSVHKLRPSDIKVVGALGDSLTAALGANAKTIIGLLSEYRGRSWSIGGRNLKKENYQN